MTSPLDKFRERLKLLRHRRGLSQDVLAQQPQVAVSQDTVSRWERGDGYPDLRELMGLCALFEVAPNYMLGLSDQEHGLQSGMFLVDLEKVEDHGYDELLAVQIPTRARVVDYSELQRLIGNTVKAKKRKKGR